MRLWALRREGKWRRWVVRRWRHRRCCPGSGRRGARMHIRDVRRARRLLSKRQSRRVPRWRWLQCLRLRGDHGRGTDATLHAARLRLWPPRSVEGLHGHKEANSPSGSPCWLGACTPGSMSEAPCVNVLTANGCLASCDFTSKSALTILPAPHGAVGVPKLGSWQTLPSGAPQSTTWPALMVVGHPGGADGTYVSCVPSKLP